MGTCAGQAKQWFELSGSSATALLPILPLPPFTGAKSDGLHLLPTPYPVLCSWMPGKRSK